MPAWLSDDHPAAAARAFALAAHGDQTYGDQPYSAHLDAVAETLWRFGQRHPDLLAAAFLHDTVEDTDATVPQVRDRFGDRVAELVHAVTTESGRHRDERNAATYPKISGTTGAVILKLADRISNVEACWRSRDARLFMYHREYPGFREALRGEPDEEVRAMWDQLDRLLGWWDGR